MQRAVVDDAATKNNVNVDLDNNLQFHIHVDIQLNLVVDVVVHDVHDVHTENDRAANEAVTDKRRRQRRTSAD